MRFLSIKFLSIILLSFQIISLKAVHITIWVHGTYPALNVLRAPWCPIRPKIYVDKGLSLAKNLPEAYYYYQLAQSLHQLNPVLYNWDHFYTYGWHSSNVRPGFCINEGKKLYEALKELIDKYQQEHEHLTLRIIGFSHGGNVILNMVSHLPFQNNKVCVELVLIGTPIQESTSRFINNPYITKAYSFYSDGDWVQKIDIQRFHHNCPKGAPFLSQRKFKDTDKVQQICFTLNGRKIGHTRYRSILKYLPDMMNQIEQKLADNFCDQVLCFDYKIPANKNRYSNHIT
jgi:hypothetical protein